MLNSENLTTGENDEGWRSIGLPANAIDAAKAAFDTPEQARPWVNALQRYPVKPEALRAAIKSGIDPDGLDRWPSVGVDSWNVINMATALSAAGLGPKHVERWRAAKLNGLVLPEITPYLSESLNFDDVVEILETWDVHKSPGARTPRAEQLLQVLATGIDGHDLTRLRKSGVSGAQLLAWCSSGVPGAEWSAWVGASIGPADAAKFVASGVSATDAKEWMHIGLSAERSLDLIAKDIALAAVRKWIAAGVAGPDAASYLVVGTTLETAREWRAAGLRADEAATFMGAHVPLDEARRWIESADHLTADDMVHYISLGVTLSEAKELERRGISPDQVTRDEAGLQFDLDPWQEDPADQLPDFITSGHFGMVLWSTAAGGDYVPYDISFTWDGEHAADWYQDISIVADLSMASSSPIRGTADWADGCDVWLTYQWHEMGYEGGDVLRGMAPNSADPAGVRDPQSWIRLGHALIDWVYRTF